MKKQKTLCVAILCSVCAICGCSLENPLTCEPGSHINAEQTECLHDSISECGNLNTDCTLLPGVDTASLQCILQEQHVLCTIGKCADGYAMVSGIYDMEGNSDSSGNVQNFCISEGVTLCGVNSVNCEAIKPDNAEEVTCDEKTHQCRIISCKSSKYKLTHTLSSVDWANQCVEVTDKECVKTHCVGDKYDNASSFECDSERINDECHITSCDVGYYLYGGVCHENTDAHCGSYENSCLNSEENPYPELVKTMKCGADGQCFIFECLDEAELRQGICVEKQYECDEDNPDISKRKYCEKSEGVKTVQCNMHVCQVSDCEMSTHHPSVTNEGLICVPQQLTDCATTTTSHDCTLIPGFDKGLNGTCQNGQCMVEDCETGYHTVPGKFEDAAYTTCESDDVNKCGSEFKNCRSEIEHSALTSCLDGECYVDQCEVGFHPDSSKNKMECIKDTNKACGQEAVNCFNEYVNSAACKEGVCEVTCKYGAHPDSKKTTCIPDSKTECGLLRRDCTKIDRATSVECEDATCVVYACEPGSGPNPTRTACPQDSSSMCGGISTKCNKIGEGTCVNGQCVYTSCKNGYRKQGTDCCLIGNLHITSSTGLYTNNDIVCANSITMDDNIKSVKMHSLKNVTQFQTCTKSIGTQDDATNEPDIYTSYFGEDCKASLETLELPSLQSAYGLYINGSKLETKFYSLQKLNWLQGSAKTMFAPLLKSIDGDIDVQTSCDVDFFVENLYTPKLTMISLLRNCIYLSLTGYKPMNWVYNDAIKISASGDEDCIDIDVNPMPPSACTELEKTCPNDFSCSP